MQTNDNLRMLHLVLARLERVSVDSYWAHRASGLRGSLLRTLEKLEAGDIPNERQFNEMLKQGYAILEWAAQERVS